MENSRKNRGKIIEKSLNAAGKLFTLGTFYSRNFLTTELFTP